ncbi:adenine phosphoribosyltransferase [Oceanospirillum multiglobuliferum]|uniref:Adenine phosphoribosyltransferase n=1 Tax=Oceanospirillum multiglobuliferum TaxID=64969 RepID=A0A1T4N7C0_9GAMM|nr:adenine phosphoribosyltransferase [Oceanospirillum multiglobuliferum]OPX55860.1 adenine phosphoribosyltransferase [Oceanospirillum multiglobuliferum]SJZ74986.1 adenine phosphoribosyltransferase [Oceanospirillum multiglobuliferum]
MPDRYYSEYIRSVIRTVPDWPEQGVMFRDVTTLFKDKKAFRYLIDAFVQRYYDHGIDAVAGVDARGFILGAPIAYELNTSFIPVRKKGKLPFDTVEESYELEYGSATVELHTDALSKGQRVLLIDDLIATGGTMLAAAKLIQRLGADVVEAAAIIDLPDLGGSAKLKAQGIEVYSICQFDGA